MTHEEAMWYIRRACNLQRAAIFAKVDASSIRQSLKITPPKIKADQVRKFLNRYIEDDFDKLFWRINRRTYTTVVFWHQGKIRDGHHERIDGLNGMDVIGYYDFEVRVKDLMDDLIAYIYDTTGDSII